MEQVDEDPASLPCVRVIDDDGPVRDALARLLRTAGYDVKTFPSGQAFLSQPAYEPPGCLVLDLSMPGLDGLELQQALERLACPLPVVFLSGRGNVQSCACAMKAGAVDFLTKPFEADELIAAVNAAVDKDRAARRARRERASIDWRMASLTPREREVLAQLVEGKLNKQIAAELGAAEKTIKVHRARVLCKMGARSIAALVRMTEQVERAGT